MKSTGAWRCIGCRTAEALRVQGFRHRLQGLLARHAASPKIRGSLLRTPNSLGTPPPPGIRVSSVESWGWFWGASATDSGSGICLRSGQLADPSLKDCRGGGGGGRGGVHNRRDRNHLQRGVFVLPKNHVQNP